jgi:nucleoside-diphosphate-sugar epimerase
MKKHKVSKIAYISSSMVYERCNNHPSKEEDAFESTIPSTDYGMSKLVGEKLCRAFARQYGINYVIWRPFNIITPHEVAEKEQGLSHVFADFIKNLIVEKKNPLPIFGDGEQIRCFTWIEDIANAIGEYSFESKTDNETYNLGNPEPITMKELARLIYQGTDELTFKTVKEYSDDVTIRIPDISKATKELGFKPSKKVKDSVKVCLEKLN